jgi:hypothetical protein
MKVQCFPLRWDEECVNRLIEHYESLSEEQQVAEDEAAISEQKGGPVPENLLPAIRQLLGRSK